MGIDKSSVRFIVHTALSGGMESWYQEVGRAGRDDERAHVVLLVDPPNAKCREYLSSRQLMQPLCNYSQGCPYGKEALCDYGKQHMFIKRSYPGVVPDALRAVRLLDKVYTEAPSDEQGWAKVSTPHTQIAANELCLYRLMVLGVVEDYRITYARPGQPAHFHICLHPAVRGAGNPADSEEAAIEEIRKHLRWHLRDVRLSLPSTEERSLEQYVDTIKKLEKYHAMKPLYDAVFNNLRMLLRHTYSTVLTMRYDMLWGLLQVVTCTECRRKFILRHFQAENSVPDDYKCGLCDICNPSLEHFPAASRTPEMVSDAKLDAQFEALLARGAFDLPALDKMADAFSAHYSVSKFGRAWSVLEGDPTNLVALYFAIRFSEAEEPSGLIERLFLTANHLLPDRSIKELYGNLQRRLRGRLNLLARQLSVLNEGGSSCDTLVGWDFLAKEATASLPHGDEAVAMMGECLEFFLFVDRDLLGAVHRFRDRVVELEKEFHA